MENSQAIESKVKQIMMKCPIEGCGIVLQERNWRRHAKNKHVKCFFRVDCCVGGCESSFRNFNWAREHLRKIHRFDKDMVDKKMVKIREEFNIKKLRGIFDYESEEEEQEKEKEKEIDRVIMRRKMLRSALPQASFD